VWRGVAQERKERKRYGKRGREGAPTRRCCDGDARLYAVCRGSAWSVLRLQLSSCRTAGMSDEKRERDRANTELTHRTWHAPPASHIQYRNYQ